MDTFSFILSSAWPENFATQPDASRHKKPRNLALLGDYPAFCGLFSVQSLCVVNTFTPGSAKSKIDNSSKSKNWVKLKTKQHHSQVLVNSFPMNGNN